MDRAELIELIFRILADPMPPGPLDAAYLYAQTADNQSSVLDRAPELAEELPCRRLLVAESEARNGYPGYRIWEAELLKRAVPAEMIFPVPTGGIENLNTRTEAEAVIQLCEQHRIGSLAVVACPLHQVRAFMTMASVALERGSAVTLYSIPGLPLDWQSHVVHSQGIVRGKRSELIAGEIERIGRYEAKGDLAAPSAILQYLDNRGMRS